MLKTTRLAIGLLAATLGLALGCNNEKAPKPPEPLSSVHPAEKPTSPAVPPSVGTSRSVSSDASAYDQITEILTEHDVFTRVRKLTELLPQLGPEAVEDVKQLLELQHYNLAGAENVLLTRFWALHDPEEATTWAVYRSREGFRLSVTLIAMEAWASKDPLAAGQFVSSLMSNPMMDTVAVEYGLISGWFQSEVPGLETYIRALGVGNMRQRALRSLTRLTIEEYGPDAAINWAVSLPEDEGKFKLAAYRQLGKELGSTHPAAAVTFCAAHCSSEFGAGVRELIAQLWANRDGPAAMAWVRDTPTETPRQKMLAVKSAFRGFERTDKASLYAWMDSMGPEGVEPWLQPALEMLGVHVGRKDPQRGLEWAHAIVNEKDRTRTMTTIAISWRKKDPESADAWLATSPLPEVNRERVRLYGQKGTPRENRDRIKAAMAEGTSGEEAGEEAM
ncbi:MAG: hypothetical protein JRE71_07835 [Deltaproteobacteria bacterium]|nr:hypothetical protein [Deltaproteobacteria bacterium]